MKLSPPPHILIIGYVWPEPCSSAAGIRDWDFIRIFKKAGWRITFSSPSGLNSYASAIEAEGIATYTFKPNDPAFDPFISQLSPDVVLFDRFVIEEQFGWRVRDQCPNALLVLDTQDLHLLRRARERALTSGASLDAIFDTKIDLHSDDSNRELASIYRCDLSLILSDFETALLVEHFGVSTSLLMTFGFCYPEPLTLNRPYQDRSEYVMIGNFRHPPNADATFWLKNEIWPYIRALSPAAQVFVYGAYPSREIMQLNDPITGFRVMGPADHSIETLRNYRVNLAPLRFGAGIKGKIADGWMAGTPAVGTPLAAEGMQIKGEWGGLVARDARAFAAAAVRLHSDPELWESAVKSGTRILKNNFEFSKLQPLLLKRIHETQDVLSLHRKKNIVGEILWYHGNRSTQYFSKWIELKNQISAANDSRAQNNLAAGNPIETPKAL